MRLKLRNTARLIKAALASTALIALPLTSSANGLPTLGDFSSSIVSVDTEHKLGQSIIRQIRNANQNIEDPIVESYVYDLIWDLVTTSQLSDRRIFPVVIGNLSVNAFAAPGGVLGIHAGIILAAHNEAELASVISHELAHLSQRHFAARLEQQRLSSPFSIASVLAGILVSVANPKAGAAVLTTSKASQISSDLAFSRSNEQEADRIGMQNLVKSGYDPSAMPNMFGRLLDMQRLQGALPPDFLLTHPTSSARVADSKNRAAQLGKGRKDKNTMDFAVVQARLTAMSAQQKKIPLKHYQALAKNQKSPFNTLTLAMVLAANLNFKEALNTVNALPRNWQNHLLVKLSIADIKIKDRQLKSALSSLKQLNSLYPKHVAIQLLYAKALVAAQQPQLAIQQLEQVTQYSPDNINAWYLLAEAYGLNGNRNQTHTARIHFFLLKGQVETAKRQLSFARRELHLTARDSYILDDLEEEIAQVDRYMNTRF